MAAHLGSLAFVPTADGRLQMPRELYDPRSPPCPSCSLPSSTALGLNKQLHLYMHGSCAGACWQPQSLCSCVRIGSSDLRLHYMFMCCKVGSCALSILHRSGLPVTLLTPGPAYIATKVELKLSLRLCRRHLPAGRAATMLLQLSCSILFCYCSAGTLSLCTCWTGSAFFQQALLAVTRRYWPPCSSWGCAVL